MRFLIKCLPSSVKPLNRCARFDHDFGGRFKWASETGDAGSGGTNLFGGAHAEAQALESTPARATSGRCTDSPKQKAAGKGAVK